MYCIGLLPLYKDLAKNVNDLFTKGYHFGQLKVSTKANTCSGTEFSTNATHKIEDSSFSGDVQAKHKYAPLGINTTTKWSTDGNIKNELISQDYLTRGLKVGVESNYNIDTGAKKIAALTEYKVLNVTVNGNVEASDENSLQAGASAVVGYKGFIIGSQGNLDGNEGVLSKHTIAAGYIAPDFSSLLHLENLDRISYSLFANYNPKFEVGVQAAARGPDENDEGTVFGVAGKYVVDAFGLTLRGKVNNNSELGLGCDVKVNGGCKLFLSTNINLKEFSAGGHQAGLALEFQ